jgi:hypothetical protein
LLLSIGYTSRSIDWFLSNVNRTPERLTNRRRGDGVFSACPIRIRRPAATGGAAAGEEPAALTKEQKVEAAREQLLSKLAAAKLDELNAGIRRAYATGDAPAWSGFMADQIAGGERAEQTIAECCRALRVSPSGFYALQERPESRAPASTGSGCVVPRLSCRPNADQHRSRKMHLLGWHWVDADDRARRTATRELLTPINGDVDGCRTNVLLVTYG